MGLQKHKAVVCATVLNDPSLAAQIPEAKNLSVRSLAQIFELGV